MANDPSEAPAAGPLVFVTDSSGEAATLSTTLRGRGYSVVDVPLSLLAGRVAAHRPALILCDVDADGALETVSRLRDVPGGSGIDIIFLGEAGKTLDDMADAVFHEGSGFFVRPVDVYAVTRKVEALIGSPSRPPTAGASAPPTPAASAGPPALAASSRPPPTRQSVTPSQADVVQTYAGADRPSVPLDDDDDELPHAPSLPPAVPLGADLGAHAPPGSLRAAMSSELQQLLTRAEARVDGTGASPQSERPSPDQEIESVLPADVLAALDEPLEYEDEEEEPDDARQTGSRQTTGSGSGGTGVKTGHGVRREEAGTGLGTGAGTGVHGARPDPHMISESARPAPSTEAAGTLGTGGLASLIPAASALKSAESSVFEAVTNPGRAAAPVSVAPLTELDPSSPRIEPPAASVSTTPPRRGEPEPAQPKAPLDIPSTLATGDAVLSVARAIRARFSGGVAFEGGGGIRRVVLRDGDFVTAASGIEGESLIAFLAERGDLAPDVAQSLGRRIAQFGRHAGAALVAHGHLQQDQLWPVLRSHAEWILGRAMMLESGAAGTEQTVPGRLEEEPAVFGGATGAEVFVEVVRRVVPPAEALRRLGGISSALDLGPSWALLPECALPDAATQIVQRSARVRIGDLVAASAGEDIATILYALRELGVLERVAPGAAASESAHAERPSVDDAVIDEDAMRARVAARMALVREGDYFAVLGVSRDATGYDVRRAYAGLRRELDPSRALTARTAHLTEDVETILEVLDEAYEILRDNVRRERYRRAIEARP